MSFLTASLLAYCEARKAHAQEWAFYAELAEELSFASDYGEAWTLFAEEWACPTFAPNADDFRGLPEIIDGHPSFLPFA
jgi:hypothetical protein